MPSLDASHAQKRADTATGRDSGEFESVNGSGDFGRMYVDAERGSVAYEAATQAAEKELEPFRAGRYVIMKHLGHGAMGNVFLAYDPDLDRKVAVKMLRESSRSLLPASLVREAKAMARLTHPNVVSVFDVGVCERGVYVAMELVEGVTLRAWLKDQARTWREVLEVFLQAGRGLAAAHEAGLIHHDFKPDNVLVGARGRAMVGDFGLARVCEATSADMSGEISDAGATRRGTGTDGSSTVASSRGPVGTLAYMAPERLQLRPSDARSDQFSYCVALYEGVYGRRPFAGEDAASLRRALLQGRPLEPARGGNVPPRLWKIVKRGLSREPEARYSSMDALLAELAEIAAERPRRPWRALAAAAAVSCGAGFMAFQTADGDRCAQAGEALAAVWTPEVRAALHDKFAAGGARWQRVESRLDDYVAGWRVRREAVCNAATKADVAASDELRARAACLEHPRMRVEALIELLAGSSRVDEGDAERAALQLPALADCDDRELLALGLRPPDAHVRPRVSALRAGLERARVREVSGEYTASLKMAEETVAAARGLDYPPLVAEALYQRGRVEHYLGRSEAAVQSLSEAVDVAEASRHEVLVAEVWQFLVEVGALHWRPGLPVLEWSRRARASAERLGRPEVDGRARALQAEGLIARGRKDPRAAEAAFRKALSLWAQSPAPDGVALAKLKLNLATALVDQQGDPRETATLYTEAEQGFVAALGPRHPYVLVALYNLGLLEEQRGRLDAARAAFERGLAVARYVFGDSHGKVLELHLALARVDLYEGLASSALAHGEAARQIFDETGSADDGVFAVLGEAYMLLGRHAEALAAAERELQLVAELYGPTDQGVARAHAKAGEALLGLHQPDEAEARFLQARALLSRIEADPDAAGFVLKGLGQAELIRGRMPEAAQLLREASSVWAAAGSDFREVADTQWCLAEALQALGEQRPADERRAAAGRFYAGFGEAGARRPAELAGWLRPPA